MVTKNGLFHFSDTPAGSGGVGRLGEERRTPTAKQKQHNRSQTLERLGEVRTPGKVEIRIESYLCRKMDAMQFELRPALFWDVNVDEVDLTKHRASVIERVATRGRLDEFRAMVKFYGPETVKTTLLNARHLDKRTLSYCSLIFDVPITEFRCYKLAQLNPEHWNY